MTYALIFMGSTRRSVRYWNHLQKHRIRTPMSPNLDGTYRIQNQTIILNLNMALEMRRKRAAAPQNTTMCGVCRNGNCLWE